MALTVRADAQDLPSIFQILGLGGPPPTEGQAPPIDSAIAGAPDTPEQNAVPTKLGRLTQVIQASQGNADHPLMTDEHNSPAAAPRSLMGIIGGPEAGPDPSALTAMAQGPDNIPEPAGPVVSRGRLPDVNAGAPTVAVQKSWAEEHPGLAKILKVGLGAAKGAGAGAGSTTFGEGFQRAQELPIQVAAGKLGLQEKRAQIAHTQAATEQMKSQVTLPNGLTVPFALAQKLYPTLTTEQGKNTRAQAALDSKEAIALRNKGLKLNDKGEQVPIPYEELTPTEQTHIDLQRSQKAYADARAAYDKAKGDPNSQAYQLALERMKTARMNAQTALGRLNLGNLKYRGDYLGVDAENNPLPGIPLTDNGTPIGIHTANVTKPTNATRSKAEQAKVIKAQGEDLLRQIDDHPEIFGIVAGRWNQFNAGDFGGASQDERDAYTSLKSFAALQPALHGSRGIGMQRDFEDAVGHLRDNPEGLKGSIGSLLRTASNFERAGTMKTASGGGAHTAQPAATHVYDPKTGIIAPVTPAK